MKTGTGQKGGEEAQLRISYGRRKEKLEERKTKKKTRETKKKEKDETKDGVEEKNKTT